MNPHGKEDKGMENLSKLSCKSVRDVQFGTNQGATPEKEARNQTMTMKSREQDISWNLTTILMSLINFREQTNEYNAINVDGQPLMPKK